MGQRRPYFTARTAPRGTPGRPSDLVALAAAGIWAHELQPRRERLGGRDVQSRAVARVVAGLTALPGRGLLQLDRTDATEPALSSTIARIPAHAIPLAVAVAVAVAGAGAISGDVAPSARSGQR